MAKDILTIIKEMAAKEKSTKRSLLECREDIQKGLDAGCSLKEIWQALRQLGKINYTYSGFVQAVRKFIVASDSKKTSPKKVPQYTEQEYSVRSPSLPAKTPASNESSVGSETDGGEDGEISASVLAGLDRVKKKG